MKKEAESKGGKTDKRRQQKIRNEEKRRERNEVRLRKVDPRKINLKRFEKKMPFEVVLVVYDSMLTKTSYRACMYGPALVQQKKERKRKR